MSLKALRARQIMAERSWFSIQAKADEADVLIYDYIGWGGVTAADFAKELQAIKAKTINVRINSPGGDVFDGLAIYNTLKSHGARVQVRVDGVAASIASIIAMAGDVVTMGESAFFMVHHPWAFAMGNATELRALADTLDKIGDSLAGIYAGRTKASREQVIGWMDAESWFNAEESKALGLADAVQGGDDEEAAQARARFDLSSYANAPAALKASAQASTEPDAESVQRAELMRRRLALVERGECSR